MNVVFCGTPQFAVPTLAELAANGFHIPLVVTQPDRPRGRGMEVTPGPVKALATQLGLPVTQPERLKNNEEFRDQLATARPDAIVVVAYGRIIPQWMIDLPPLGNINLHASLLPKYRGAAPIQWAIARGETTTGVTTMRIDAGLDTGDILLMQEVPIETEDTSLTLAPKLAEIGAKLTVRTLREYSAGQIQPSPQDHSRATLAPLLKKEDGLIDFRRTAVETWNRLRGFQPWPGAFTTFRKRTLNIWSAKPVENAQIEPGTLQVSADRLLLGCGSGTVLELFEVQPEGKKRMTAREFINGYRPKAGERLGE
jgi:methionyl-tRNA formyltransferase